MDHTKPAFDDSNAPLRWLPGFLYPVALKLPYYVEKVISLDVDRLYSINEQLDPVRIASGPFEWYNSF